MRRQKIIFGALAIFFAIANFGFCASTDWPDDMADWTSDQDIEEAQFSDDISFESGQQLSDLYEQPIEANSATESDLLRLPGIEKKQARAWTKNRKKNGDYYELQDLVARKILTQDQADRLRLFVRFDLVLGKAADKTADKIANKTADKLSDKKNGVPTLISIPVLVHGNFYHKTVSRPDARFQNSSQLASNLVSPTQDFTSFGLRGVNVPVRLRSFFIGDDRTVAVNADNPSAPLAQEEHSYRLEKFYFAWDPKFSQGHIWPYLHQFYVGNFKSGLYNSEKFSRALGFYTDESLAALPTIQNSGSSKNATPFRGIGVQLGGESLRPSIFISEEKFPASAWVSKVDALTGNLHLSSQTVDRVWNVETKGISLEREEAHRFGNHQTGIFISDQQEKLEILGQQKAQNRSLYWGFIDGGNLEDVEYQAAFSRSDTGVENAPDRNFYFFQLQQNFSSALWNFTFQRIEPGYRNRLGTIFSGKHLWRVSQTLVQDWDALRLELRHQSGERHLAGYTFSTQQFQTRLRWKTKRKVLLQLVQKYDNPGTLVLSQSFNSDGTIRSVSLNRYEQFSLSARLRVRPARWLESRLDWSGSDNKRVQNNRFLAAQKLAAQMHVLLNSTFDLQGGISYSDTDVDRPNTETQTFFAELRARPKPKLEIFLRWKNVSVVRTQTVIDESGLIYDLDNPGVSNEITLRASYRW